MKTPPTRSLIFLLLLWISACRPGGSKKTDCDTACLTDTLRFQGDHALQPWVHIGPKECRPQTISWGYKGLGVVRTTDFGYGDATVSPEKIRCIFGDTSQVYILFNDCKTGRGYQIRLPFSKSGTISKRSSGINNLDPRFEIAAGLIAYTDRGNIYVEEVQTGKKAMMTFGKALDIDYDDIHEHIDSVRVTTERIRARVKIDNKWTEKEKKIILE
ncbi:MAG: hypothetical protein RJA57_1720 [Bacteroidota bacterium]|jgi:hypothetical protein